MWAGIDEEDVPEDVSARRPLKVLLIGQSLLASVLSSLPCGLQDLLDRPIGESREIHR
jgi:hypothetical protein